MQFQIITPERVVSSDEIEQVSVPTSEGEITILKNHIPLVSVIKPGELKYKKDGEDFSLAVSGGFLEVRENGSVVILADTAEHAHEIDIERAEEAKVKAVELMKESRNKEEVEFEAFESQLEKHLVRLNVGNKYRKLKK